MRISDWSSDVCSSDLLAMPVQVDLLGGLERPLAQGGFLLVGQHAHLGAAALDQLDALFALLLVQRLQFRHGLGEGLPDRRLVLFRQAWIGRASCRERVCPYV